MAGSNINITFEKARELLLENLERLETTQIEVDKSLSCVLSKDIKSPVNLPSYTSSAVDGYAVCVSNFGSGDLKFKIVGEIRAGERKRVRIREGEAVKIYTGSVLPEGANACVMKEFCEERDGFVLVKKKIKEWENIRFEGEEIKKGEVVLKKGTLINPAVIGFLSAMGIKYVNVFRKPKVFVIVTGSEVRSPGEKIRKGELYDANSFSVKACLNYLGVDEFKILRVKDNLKLIKKHFERGLKNFDIIVFTGGISVGEYDYVRDLMKGEVETVFYKVKQKPGKPIYFGKKGRKFIFGLPGNPAAVLTCMVEYVIPAIKFMMGYERIFPEEKILVLKNEIKKKSDRLYFLRGYFEGEGVRVLPNQESHMLSSFALANCLILAPLEKEIIKEGEKVIVHLFW